MAGLQYRAGARALQRLRERGFSLEDVRGFVLPATGPRWLIAAGFDRALIEAGFGKGERRPLLIGASAGAWRALAIASEEPLRAQAALIEGYCTQRFRQGDSAAHVSGKYRELIADVLKDADVAHVLDHPSVDLAVTVVRARGWGAQGARARMLVGLAGAAALNLVWSGGTQLFFERVVFHTQRAHALLDVLRGRRVQLTAENLRAAALASGSVPIYMEPVLELTGAGPGGFLDGGLADYHVNQPLRVDDGLVLMFSHQSRVVPGWFDKSLSWRRGPGCEDLLVVHPDAEWIASLPGGYVPTREDFFDYERTPGLRIARWREAAERSRELGEMFLEDLARGRVAERAVLL